MGTEQRILDKLIEMSLLPEIERKTSISVKHMQVFEYLTTFTHFFVEFCRDRRLRAFSKISKILASSLFSFPCLSQILSSTPGGTGAFIILALLNKKREAPGPDKCKVQYFRKSPQQGSLLFPKNEFFIKADIRGWSFL